MLVTKIQLQLSPLYISTTVGQYVYLFLIPTSYNYNNKLDQSSAAKNRKSNALFLVCILNTISFLIC